MESRVISDNRWSTTRVRMKYKKKKTSTELREINWEGVEKGDEKSSSSIRLKLNEFFFIFPSWRNKSDSQTKFSIYTLKMRYFLSWSHIYLFYSVVVRKGADGARNYRKLLIGPVKLTEINKKKRIFLIVLARRLTQQGLNKLEQLLLTAYGIWRLQFIQMSVT